MDLRDVRLAGGDGRPVDLVVADGRIASIRASSGSSGSAVPSRTEISGGWQGAWVLPGLWDHHVHPVDWAASRHRLDLSEATSPALALEIAAAELRRPGGPPAELTGCGLRHSRWQESWGEPGGPNRAVLDVITGEVPTTLISADLHSAWMNSAALGLYGQPFSDSGLVAETDWFGIMPRIGTASEALRDRRVIEAGRAAAARGVVGIIDFDPIDTHAAWRRRVAAGFDSHRVRASVWPEFLTDAITAGLQSGDAVPGGGPLVRMGSVKIVSDGSLNTRTAWCHDPYPGGGRGAPNLSEAELRATMDRATRAGISSAIHAIGDRAVGAALDAFAATGASGSIEHAQLVRDDDLPRLARLGLTASVQPLHVLDDRDVAEELWPQRTGRAYRFADLLSAGVRLTFGSDAPVAPLDPWAAIAAAVLRTGDDRAPWHADQRLSVVEALRATCGRAPRVALGDVADLVLTEVDPLTANPQRLADPGVVGTICSGRITFDGR